MNSILNYLGTICGVKMLKNVKLLTNFAADYYFLEDMTISRNLQKKVEFQFISLKMTRYYVII